MYIILFYLASIWGLTHILVSSKIFMNTRDWLLIAVPFIGEMLNCYQCTSFWVSIILYFCFDGLDIGIRFSLDPLIWGFIGSAHISALQSQCWRQGIRRYKDQRNFPS